MLQKDISILGCGWLGLPLAKHLIKQGHHVNGTTTNLNKIDLLKTNQIKASLFKFGNNSKLNQVFLSSGLLIIATPHKILTDYKYLLDQISKSNIKKVIFISSTSVYHANSGLVNEDSMTDENSELVKIENLFKNEKAFKTTILRFAGLIGPGRHPGLFFKSNNPIPNPKGVVNFIHLEDCIQIIKQIIKQNDFPNTYNCAIPDHPSREEFYTKAFKLRGRKRPTFTKDDAQKIKTISCNKLENILNYHFKYNNLINYIKTT